MMKKGQLYWITGLSGAGKTTIGKLLYQKLSEKYENIVFLDGDIMKKVFESTQEIDYSSGARKERAMKYARLCNMLVDQGLVVVCCTISMFDDVRNYNREHNSSYTEIFLDVPMDVLMKRNQKGLYEKCQKGQNVAVAGVNVEIEFPKHPDITICNDGNLTIEECVSMIIKHAKEN